MSTDRNAPCPCGSGLKYKKCCLPKQQSAAPVDAGWLRMRRTEGELTHRLSLLLDRDYGRESVARAWDEYTLWPEPPADPRQWPEFDSSFVPWLLFDWEPGRFEPKRRRQRATIPLISPARHLIERRGADLDSYELRYLEEACGQPFTFCQVMGADPGRQLTLRDIFRRRDVTVHEQQASKTLRPGQIIYTKITTMDGESVMLGCAPIALSGRRFDTITQARDAILGRRGAPDKLMRKYDVELRQLYLDLREAEFNSAPPTLQNTDGDPLALMRLDFELACSPQEALDALLPMTGENDPAAFASDCHRDAKGVLVAANIPWLRAKGTLRSAQNTVLAELDIRAGRLAVRVNSQRRADAVRAEIAARLGDRARFKGSVVESVEQMMAAGPAARESDDDDLQQLPEVQAMLARMSREHWATWPDIPVPALRGRTPRQAARTAAGRERLEALLLEFAGRELPSGVPGPDIEALRRELGLDREQPAARKPAMSVVDLTHFTDARGRLPRLAVQAQEIVDRSTNCPNTTPQPTDIPCRRRPGRQPCPGRLLAHQEPATGEIRWSCPACGDAGVIHHWQGTAHDHGGRPFLPQVTRITLETGFQRRPGDAAELKKLTFEGAAVTEALRRAVLDNRITELEGEYGDPAVGSPMQVDRLEIEYDAGTTRITVYNRAIMLVHTDDEQMRRLHRICGVIERANER